jgi:hypothetical protein
MDLVCQRMIRGDLPADIRATAGQPPQGRPHDRIQRIRLEVDVWTSVVNCTSKHGIMGLKFVEGC